MILTRDHMLQRFYARDRASDGRFITGVLTTGIYCLPSCTARKPLPENVRFFANRDDARAAGLRACLRCRPDDFYQQYDPDVHLLDTRVGWRPSGCSWAWRAAPSRRCWGVGFRPLR
jgi:AraC family transcriptional regulator of adaptative response / DNA-3-methyladenine glycosylase II